MKKLKLLIATCLIGGSAFAQCAAGFTFVVNPANNGSVAFTSTSTGTNGSTHYTYDFGDGTSSAYNANPTHTYTSGIYSACLTLSDSLGTCSSTYCDSFYVNNNTLPTCSAYFIAADSVNNNVLISNYSTGSGLTYSWNFGDGNTSTTGASTFAHQYATAGAYVICLTVTNTGATCTNSYCDTIMISNCHAGFTMMQDSVGNGCTFTSTSTGTANTYFWDFGDGDTAHVQNPYHVYSSNGYYTACLTVSSTVDTTCSDTHCAGVSVYGNCQAIFGFWTAAPYTVHIQNHSNGSNLTYLWDYGDGTTSTLAGDSIHAYSSGGTYNICLTVSNAGTGCTSSVCHLVYFSTCIASFTAVADSTGGNGVTFQSTTTGGPTTYLWNFGDGNTSSAQNPYHVYSNPGYYNACLTVSSTVDTNCYDQSCAIIAAGSFCNANFSIVQDSMNLYNYTIYNNAFSNGTITSYLWNWGDSTTSNTAYPTHTYAWSIPYQICLTITTSNGCSATHCDSIWPGHGVNQITTVTVLPPLTTSIVDHSALTESLNNYPNPFTNITTISYTVVQNTPVELCLYDLLGNKITEIENGNKSAGNYKTDLDATSISAGIYLLQLRTETKVISKKLVITR